MFSHLLFFSSVLFETKKDLWTIMEFCYELFNKTKQKKTGPFPFIHLTYHCSHSKNNQALLEAQNGKFSNPHLHLAIRFPYCLIHFWKWKSCNERQGERTNLKEMWEGVYLQGSIFKRAQKWVYKMWVNMLLHTHSHLDERETARSAPHKAGPRSVHRALPKQEEEAVNGESPGQGVHWAGSKQIPMVLWAWQKAGQR